MEPVFATGSRGFLIGRLQLALSKTKVTRPDGKSVPALNEEDIDEDFGPKTRKAVRLVQKERGEAETGTVDAALWHAITGDTWPSEFERRLHLIAGYEGHDFYKARGNWDNAGITWGIIGFTLLSSGAPNSLPRLLKSIATAHPTLIEEAFGKDNAKELTTVLDKSGSELLKFAEKVTDIAKRPKAAAKEGKDAKKVVKRVELLLLKPWQDGFEALGQYPEVQALQVAQATREYYDPANKDAKEFAAEFPSLDCEQARQWFFDVHVNNGGSKISANRETFKRALRALGPASTVTEQLLAVTDALAQILPDHERDIRERKGTIARGQGIVHKTQFRLEGWGIKVAVPVVKHPLWMGMLAFEPQQVLEQLTLAKAATSLVNPELAATSPETWPAGNGTELLVREDGGAKVRSLSLRPLLSAVDAGALTQDAAPLTHAIAMTFSRPIGILGVFGQCSPPKVCAPRLVFARGPYGYAGLDVSVDGTLQLFRQRFVAEKPEAARLDVADIRRSLATCQMIFLFGSNGISPVAAESSPARLWRQFLQPFGASPIVLGWFGNAGVPSDANGRFVSGEFLARVRALDANLTLAELCQRYGDKIVQLWGQACHATYAAAPRQRFLWRDGPFAGVFPEDSLLGSVGITGAAAIGRDGQLYVAKKGYSGVGDAMEAVQ